MWGTTGIELSPSVGTSRSVVTLPLGSHPPSWQGFQPNVWASEKSFLDWQKRYASLEATWSNLLAWAMNAFSCAHKELSEPRWSLVDLFEAIVLWFWLWLHLWLWVVAILTWTSRLANVTNGTSEKLFNDPLSINILSKLIQNPRSQQY